MLFSQIPGLDDIKNTLINAVKQNHVAHAQLFAGNEGSANLAMALAFSTFINCENRQEYDACGACNSCNKHLKLIHPDLHFIFPVTTTKNVSKDPSSKQLLKEWRDFCFSNIYGGVYEWLDILGAENKQLNIPVSEARNIIQDLSLKAFEGKYKVQIVWLPEYMNQQTANGILKIIEEPPDKTLFLLVAQDYEKLLSTITSRCQMVKIRSFSDEEVKQHIMQQYAVDEGRAGQLAFIAEGDMNKAKQLLENVDNDHREFFRNWMLNCYYQKFSELIQISDQFHALGREGQKSVFQYGLNILREVLILKTSGEALVKLGDEDKKFVLKFSQTLNTESIEQITSLINEAFYHIERNGYGKIIFFDASVKVCGKFA